ncbi:hypothetical protein [Niallia taxi]
MLPHRIIVLNFVSLPTNPKLILSVFYPILFVKSLVLMIKLLLILK